MGGHEVGHEVLLLAGLLIHLFKQAHEFAVGAAPRLAHFFQDIVGDMFGRDPELSADVILTEFAQECTVLVRQKIIESEAGADEDFFHAGEGAELPQKGQVVAVVNLEIRAGLREEAAPVFAGPVRHLLSAGRRAELGGGAADVVDIALEIRLAQHLPRLAQDRFVTPDLDDTSLVEGQRAEIAVPAASAVRGQAEPDLAQRGDAARRIVHGMPGAHIGQRIDVVHLLHREGFRRRVLHDEGPSAIGLAEPFRLKRVCVGILQRKALRIGLFSFRGGIPHLFVIREPQRVVNVLFLPGLVDRPVDKSDVAHVQAGRQRVRDLYDAAFPHPVGNEVCARIQKDRAPHLVLPVVIMGEPPQARLEPAQDHRCLFKRFPDQVPVDYDRVVGPVPHLPARTEGILRAVLFIHRVVVHHGVHVSGRDEEAQARFPERLYARRIPPVRLAEHPDCVAVCRKDTRNNGRPEAGVVHIRVPAHIYKIELFDPLCLHILPAHGKKSLCCHILPAPVYISRSAIEKTVYAGRTHVRKNRRSAVMTAPQRKPPR